MTVDDYKLLANVMYKTKPKKELYYTEFALSAAIGKWESIQILLSEACREDNCFFEPEFFRNACNNGVK